MVTEVTLGTADIIVLSVLGILMICGIAVVVGFFKGGKK